MTDLYAVVRIRSTIGAKPKAKKAMEYLGLDKNFRCRIVKKSELPNIKRCRDYVTFGKLDKETAKKLGAEPGKVVALEPPRKGLKSKKKLFKKGGACGDRGEAINELLKRMI